MMQHREFRDSSDIKIIRQLLLSLTGNQSISDFEEVIQIRSVQQNTRLWFKDMHLIAFAYVDDFCNLCFEIAPEIYDPKLEQEIVAWGADCMRNKIKETGENAPLDSSCLASNKDRNAILKRMGFIQQEVRSLHFSRDLSDPIPVLSFPNGYIIRCIIGESEVSHLVSLHRAAFGTEHMTIEYRLAMMHAPEYDQTMDWVVTSPDGNLAAFCIGTIDLEDATLGYLDPIGTHPDHRRIGLSAGMVSFGLGFLKSRGVNFVQFGTSSENIPMQQLASRLGFTLLYETIWFSKEVI